MNAIGTRCASIKPLILHLVWKGQHFVPALLRKKKIQNLMYRTGSFSMYDYDEKLMEFYSEIEVLLFLNEARWSASQDSVSIPSIKSLRCFQKPNCMQHIVVGTKGTARTKLCSIFVLSALFEKRNEQLKKKNSTFWLINHSRYSGCQCNVFEKLR